MTRILELPVPVHCSTNFVVVVDRAELPAKFVPFVQRYKGRGDERIRVQGSNTGASEARNRALRESSADFVLFLDDDVVPTRNIIEEYSRAILSNPHESGFAGPSCFPPATNVLEAGVVMSGCTFFWNYAAKAPRVPWTVTANVVLRRQVVLACGGVRPYFPQDGWWGGH